MKKLVLGIIAITIIATMCMNVFAASVTIRPDGQGYRKGWGVYGCSGGTSEWDCVDEDPYDTDDYLKNTGTAKETFTFDDTGLSSETINSVTMYYYAMWHNKVANSCFSAMTRSGSTDYISGAQMCVNDSWQYKSHVYSTNPATSSAWTVSEVDNLEAGMRSTNPNGGGRVAQVYAVVDYNAFECGNDEIEGTEVCDGTDLGGETCSSQGFVGGTLACNEECDGFITSGCWDNSCSDTDGGFFELIFGTVSGLFEGSPYSNADYCSDNSTLVENYCSGDLSYSANVNCVGNYTGCSGGVCI